VPLSCPQRLGSLKTVVQSFRDGDLRIRATFSVFLQPPLDGAALPTGFLETREGLRGRGRNPREACMACVEQSCINHRMNKSITLLGSPAKKRGATRGPSRRPPILYRLPNPLASSNPCLFLSLDGFEDSERRSLKLPFAFLNPCHFLALNDLEASKQWFKASGTEISESVPLPPFACGTSRRRGFCRRVI
jgi:hypothetical protein